MTARQFIRHANSPDFSWIVGDVGVVPFTPTGGTATTVQTALDPSFGVSFNVLNFRQSGDTGWAAAINRAIVAANLVGGGEVTIPNILLVNYTLEDKIQMRSFVHLKGVGFPILTMQAGVNKNIIEGLDFLTLTGTNTNSGINTFKITGLRLDGDAVNNNAPAANNGHGIAIYGRNFWIDDVYVMRAYRRGIHLEYTNVGTSPYNGRCGAITTDRTGEEGVWLSVSDMHIADINIRCPSFNADNTFDGLFVAKGCMIGNLNEWSSPNITWATGVQGVGAVTNNRPRISANLDGGNTSIVAASLETAKSYMLRVANGCDVRAAHCYNPAGGTAHVLVEGSRNNLDIRVDDTPSMIGVEMGSAGTPATNNIVHIRQYGGGGLVNFVNVNGGNYVRGVNYKSPGTLLRVGNGAATDDIRLISDGSSDDRQTYIKEPTNNAPIVATGAASGTAALIKDRNNIVVSSTGTGQGVRFDSSMTASGVNIFISNDSANPINVYPHTAGQFRFEGTGPAGANVAYVLPAYASRTISRMNGFWVVR